MTRLSVDYAGLVRVLRMPLAPADLGAALLDAVAERYEHQFPDCSLLQFVQSGATYLFDLASAVGAEQEDRTLAAWTITPATVRKRDVSYQRGFPLPPDPDGTLVSCEREILTCDYRSRTMAYAVDCERGGSAA